MRRQLGAMLLLCAIATGAHLQWLDYTGFHEPNNGFGDKTARELLNMIAAEGGITPAVSSWVNNRLSSGFVYDNGEPYTHRQAWATVYVAHQCAVEGEWEAVEGYLKANEQQSEDTSWLEAPAASSNRTTHYYCNATENKATQPWEGAPAPYEGIIVSQCFRIRGLTPTYNEGHWNVAHAHLVLAYHAACSGDWAASAGELEDCCP